MKEPIQIFVRASDDGRAYATSPQAPGLIYGRGSLQELHHDLEDVLSFHFERPGPFDVVEHRERHHVIADRELVARIAIDGHQASRVAVYDRIGHAMKVPSQVESLLSAVTNVVGEAVYVCAVPSDTIGWLVSQLDPRGDAFTAAVAIADEMLFVLPFALDNGGRPTWQTVSDGLDTQLSEVIQRSLIVTPPLASRFALC